MLPAEQVKRTGVVGGNELHCALLKIQRVRQLAHNVLDTQTQAQGGCVCVGGWLCVCVWMGGWVGG